MPVIPSDKYLELIDAQPRSIYVLHEKAERKWPQHQHNKAQLTYVQGGIAYIFIGSNTYVIPARHFIWVPKGLEHYILARHPSSSIRTLYFPSRGDNAHPFYNKLGIHPINKLVYEMIIHTEKWAGNIQPGDTAFSFLKAIKDLLPELGTRTQPLAMPTSTNSRLQPIIQYLRANQSQPLTLESVGREFGMSQRSLTRLFKSNLEISFLQYLKRVRMVAAIEMILQTDMHLSQIAYATGYSSLAAFSTTFYQLANMRPSEFARRVK